MQTLRWGLLKYNVYIRKFSHLFGCLCCFNSQGIWIVGLTPKVATEVYTDALAASNMGCTRHSFLIWSLKEYIYTIIKRG